MSNQEASKVYELIVESVINEVREDFENAGIDEQTLQDLKRNWQLKLSDTKVTRFNWDLNSIASIDPTNNNITAPSMESNSNSQNLLVKEEDIDQGLILPGFDPNSNQPTIKEEDGSNTVQPDLIQANNSIENVEASENIEDDDKLDAHNNNNEESTGQHIELEVSDPHGDIANQVRLQEKKAKRSALLDTDEVGSELDDSDDDYLISEGEDDGPDENLMLCLYDKVTRTKARWKCALKDGVVTINRKDYTFQKAQVEAEWV